MAEGNIGNLLQHFVALKVAQRVVHEWNRPDDAIEYIDCYAMAPWEPITGGQPQGFVSVVRSFDDKSNNGDFVAQSFLHAWRGHYNEREVPNHPTDREYPNTALLLADSFPNQRWMMRLHENDFAEKGKQARLRTWATTQTNGTFNVAGDWQKSKLIRNRPAAKDRPVIVMLDPFRIVPDSSDRSDSPGYLRTGLLRFLCGQLALGLCGEGCSRNAPAAICLFSYSDVAPEVPDHVVRNQFDSGWQTEYVRSGPWKLRGRDSYHQAWIVSQNLKTPVIAIEPQAEWERWCSSPENQSRTSKGATDV
jgi:hypothetical protein